MATRFDKLLWKKYHAMHLAGTLVTEDVIPGKILDVDWDPKNFGEGLLSVVSIGIFQGSLPTLRGIDGTIWEALRDDPSLWKSSLREANVAENEHWSGDFGLEIGVSLPGYGINFDGSLARKFDVTIALSGVQGRTFDKSVFIGELQSRVRNLKMTNWPVFQSLNNMALVKEAYYAREFVAHFKGEGNVSAKAEFEKAKIQATPTVKFTWKTENDLEYEGTVNVPFAARVTEL